MGAPAYQLMGTAYDGIGGFGMFFGGPFGGATHAPFTVPTLYLGSDNLATKDSAEIVGPRHERHGVVVAERTWAEVGTWHVVHRGLTRDQLADLRQFWSARIFLLLHDGDPLGAQSTVRWLQRTWRPEPMRGPLFALEYDLEEQP